MSRPSRRMRRAADRSPARNGLRFEVPAGTNLDAWEAGIRNDPRLTADERAVGLALAAALRAATC